MDKCRKCGGTVISINYSYLSDMLDKECNSCGYCWSENPQDSN